MTERTQFSRRCLPGGAAWVLLACVAVGVRGVRWDESYEFAQVLLGQIPYPPGHPLVQHVFGLITVQTWSLAGFMALFPSPALANGLRNVLMLSATVLPAYLLTTALTRKPLHGHIAATLCLIGVHGQFFSNYPVEIWPYLYSNGHIGMGLALATVAILAAGHARTAALLTGILPVIHAGQFPPVFLLLLLCGFISAFMSAKKSPFEGGFRGMFSAPSTLRQATGYFLIGIGISLLFWIIVSNYAVPPPTEGPYFDAISADAVFRGYMTHHATHRAIPYGTGHIPLLGLLLLSLAATFTHPKNSHRRRAYGTVAAYATLIATIVWGTMLIHTWLGPEIPRILIAWMPYRLINHASPLLIALMVAVLAAPAPGTRRNPRLPAVGTSFLLVALLYGITRPFAANFLPSEFFERYLAHGEAVAFFLFGASAALVHFKLPEDRATNYVYLAAAFLCVLALATRHQFGTACLVAGASSPALLRRTPTPNLSTPHLTTLILYPLLALGLLVLLHTQWQTRAHLPISPFEQQVRHYLNTQDDPNAMILVRHQQEGLQSRLGHPVMTDMAAITWVPYKPSLGPSLYKVYRDLYGINLAPQTGESPYPMPWHEVWPKKSRHEWQRLSQEYRFHYILAPSFMNLDLPQVLQGETENLYHIQYPAP